MTNYNSTIRWKEVELCGDAIAGLAAQVRDEDSTNRRIEIKEAIDNQISELDELLASLDSFETMSDANPGWRKSV
ncbi:hypothetical protein LCGC14_0442690 [marine sediment metagenome]|uniref:Uncharacterized protein n=1 Tax=marine sediment metagenome TaxID=412755 RepID=A0A0F9SQW7_9ZZZZ